MYSYWNSPMHYPTRNHVSSELSEKQQLMQIISQLDNRMNHLIKLIEYNNQMLHAIEQKQNKVCTTGGGAVIVRM